MQETFLAILNNNKEWIFSGVGLVIASAILRYFKSREFVQNIIELRNYKKQVTIFIIVSLLILIAIQFFHCNNKQIPLRVASGPTGGTFSVFATVLKQSLAKDGFAILDEETQGSIENLQRLSSGKVEIALAHNGITDRSGKRPENVDFDRINAIAHIYDAKLFVAIRSDNSLNTIRYIEDIPKYNHNTLRIYAGGKNSGTRSIVNQALPQLEHFLYQDSSFDNAAALLLQNVIDVAFFLVEEHAPVIEMLRIKDENKQIYFLSFNDIEKIITKARSGTLNKCEYRDGSIVTTICVKEFLLARENIPENDIYRILKRVYRSDITQVFGQLADDPLVHADYEYHQGAINYFRDNGIKEK